MNAGSSSQHSSESRESDLRDVTLPQKKAVAKVQSVSGCGIVTVVQVEQRRRSSSSAGDHDDIDDEIDDVDDVSDSTSDVDTTATCSQVHHTYST